jgi:hypothetical protein
LLSRGIGTWRAALVRSSGPISARSSIPSNPAGRSKAGRVSGAERPVRALLEVKESGPEIPHILDRLEALAKDHSS